MKDGKWWKAAQTERVCLNCEKKFNPTSPFEHRSPGQAVNSLWCSISCREQESHRRKTYGISSKDFNLLMGIQGNACAICGYSNMSNPAKFPHIDHCHKTGRVRGILCVKCNTALGQFEDDEGRLINAIYYLREDNDDIGIESIREMPRLVTSRLCAQCGSPTKAQRKYCGTNCYTKSRYCSVSVVCVNCSKVFTTKQHRVNQGRRFCSMVCKNAAQKQS